MIRDDSSTHSSHAATGSNPYACVCFHSSLLLMITYLTLLHRRSVFIAHGTDLHPSLPLLVSLPEELLHDSLCPLAIHRQRLRGVAQVSAVHHVPQHLQKHTHVLQGFFICKKKKKKFALVTCCIIKQNFRWIH